MDKYEAIDKYEQRVNELEIQRKIILLALEDRDVFKNRELVFKEVTDIDVQIALYIDVIETINSLNSK
ncbi:hypothetical protein HFE03_07965 [Paenibacillus sp. EKM102P]|uniref:hypothetical protein n=1 Tax=unclassified Paenibacillus TaxID=185978 RepID=UPI00142DAA9C|nr:MULTISPECIES: hypothetical protein [unclassified Paenibacillus]KAF6620580.1 hypothetical protein HFE00_05870 [Paenibacillus sp. EKM101P]KAF6623572.1 hypothetical protein HFE03_07965 [Paenibacillus sp. EKM102P]KAF6633866.1 hypothetical protein HFE01_06545 [Paenibacillus sp. EKM10P]KAF6649392.1 hypothetical protein HFE02_01505 [Paenibacillus sp. EKM11P]